MNVSATVMSWAIFQSLCVGSRHRGSLGFWPGSAEPVEGNYPSANLWPREHEGLDLLEGAVVGHVGV